jgi:hypothetical protein
MPTLGLAKREGQAVETLHRWLWVMFMLIAVTMPGCAGKQGFDLYWTEHNTQKHEEFRKALSDSARVVPSWYRDRYYPTPFLGVVVNNRQLNNMLLLGLFCYPILFPVFAYRYDSEGGDYRWASWARFLFLFIPMWYLLLALLSALLSIVTYLFLGLFSDEGYYVPWDFFLFSTHVILLIGLFLLVVNPRRAPRMPSSAVTLGSADAFGSPLHNGTSRARLALAAMGKAFMVAIASGIASQIGGWIAGIVVMAVGTGFAALVGGAGHHHGQD